MEETVLNEKTVGREENHKSSQCFCTRIRLVRRSN